MIRRPLVYVTCTWLWFGSGIFDQRARTQQIGHVPVEIQVLRPPTPAIALGRLHLVYELHLTNFGSSSVTLEEIDVLDDERGVLARWNGPQLWQRVRILGRREPPGSTGAVEPGLRAIAYLWLTLQPGRAAPGSLVHRVTFSHTTTERETVTTTRMPLVSGDATIAAPVGGGPWVAVRGPSNASGHRLSLVVREGRARVPQRFAVDWALLGEDGRLFHGDRTDVTNWYGYDAPVYAVADGTVALVRDGSPDRPAFAAAIPVVLDLADAPGNVVVVEIGPGRYATYAHLRPGSLRVNRGDRVAAGQLLAQVGNSGNTLGPHLHFHISDAIEPLGGEGLPFALQSFELVGRVGSLPALLEGNAWLSNAAQPARVVTAESPLENMVVRFAAPSLK